MAKDAIHKPIKVSQQGCAYLDLQFDLQVSRRRRSIGFKVASGKVLVQVPYGLPNSVLQDALGAKYPWLNAKLAAFQQLPTPPKRSLVAGEVWLWRGQELSLQLEQSAYRQVQVDGDCLVLQHTDMKKNVDSAERLARSQARQLQAWYREQALQHAQQRVAHWQKITGLQASAVSVRRYKARWGSCNAAGAVQFNWLLIMAPDWVFDYVVVHELCHLRYMHHGPKFWQLVAHWLPDYKQAKAWFSEHGYSLTLGLPDNLL